MKREEIKSFAPIFEAFSTGKTIQVKQLDGEWKDIDNLKFDCDPEFYRIKPEHKYRPFNNSEECVNEVCKHTTWIYLIEDPTIKHQIGSISNEGVSIIDVYDVGFISYDVLNICYRFNDGTPLGIRLQKIK